jgi:hypothetical protein
VELSFSDRFCRYVIRQIYHLCFWYLKEIHATWSIIDIQ